MMKHIIRASCIALLLIPAATWSQVSLTNGLVAYFPLDGDADDASGHGINGTLYNVAPATNRYGDPDRALAFFGTNSYVDFGAPTSLQFIGNFTVSAWVKFNPDRLDDRIWSYAGDGGYELLAGENSSTRHFGVNLADIKFGVDLSPSGGQWNFVAVRALAAPLPFS